jgi:predicted secreted protein
MYGDGERSTLSAPDADTSSGTRALVTARYTGVHRSAFDAVTYGIELDSMGRIVDFHGPTNMRAR